MLYLVDHTNTIYRCEDDLTGLKSIGSVANDLSLLDFVVDPEAAQETLYLVGSVTVGKRADATPLGKLWRFSSGALEELGTSTSADYWNAVSRDKNGNIFISANSGIWFWDKTTVSHITGAYSTAAKMTYQSDPSDGEQLFIWSHGNDQFYIVDIARPNPNSAQQLKNMPPVLATNKILNIGSFTILWPMVTAITDGRVFTIAWTAQASVPKTNLTKPYPGVIVEYSLDDILYSPHAQAISLCYQEPNNQQIAGLARTPDDVIFYIETGNVHKLERKNAGWVEASTPLNLPKKGLRCGIRWVES